LRSAKRSFSSGFIRLPKQFLPWTPNQCIARQEPEHAGITRDFLHSLRFVEGEKHIRNTLKQLLRAHFALTLIELDNFLASKW
jgi:hypothetical protein